MIRILLMVTCLYCSFLSSAQRSIAVIGSSTVAGRGATPGHGWVDLSRQYLKSLGLIDTIYNLGISGALTWSGLPTGSPHPDGSDSADPKRNVTKALSFVPMPKIVIVSYPSNDIHDGWTITQYLANLRIIYNTVVAAGSTCIITTTQPRDGMVPALRKIQEDAADSIMQEYPLNYMDFYDTLVDRHSEPDTLNIKARYEFGDGIHINDSGHLALYSIARSSSDLITPLLSAPLAITITDFSATPAAGGTARIHWAARLNGQGLFHIQHSADAIHFTDIEVQMAVGTTAVKDHDWTDRYPLAGESYYRLWLSGNGFDQYSRILGCHIDAKSLDILRVYAAAGAGTVEAEIGTIDARIVGLGIYDMTGNLVQKQNLSLSAPSTHVSIPVHGLAAGAYLLQVSDAAGHISSMRFIRL